MQPGAYISQFLAMFLRRGFVPVQLFFAICSLEEIFDFLTDLLKFLAHNMMSSMCEVCCRSQSLKIANFFVVKQFKRI